jgi:arginine decarboxylase
VNLQLDQTRAPLLTALQMAAFHPAQMLYSAFHTPGHKRGQGIPAEFKAWLGDRVFQADLPELPELDNLFAPDRVIAEAQALAAAAFGAEETWFLVNGSTCGIEAAILATCRPGDPIILPRNVHRSAIAGLILSGAIPIFVEPELDLDWQLGHSVTPDGIAQAIARYPNAKAVFVVYPTYYGVGGDLAAITQIVHAHNLPLIVDEAHGAHFAFHPDLPPTALSAGADLTVQSIHKTLSALNQASMLHVQGQRIDRDRLRQALQLTQSTSPNYLLLASLDAARRQMAIAGNALMEQTLELAAIAHSQLSQIEHIRLFPQQPSATPGCTVLDRTRLTVDVSQLGLTGFEVDERLHQDWRVTCELPTLNHLMFIVTLGNHAADITQLVEAFRAIATSSSPRSIRPTPNVQPPNSSLVANPQMTTSVLEPPPLSPRDAFFAPQKCLPLSQAIGQISAEVICPYPPGIPVLMPGERITEAAIATLQAIAAAGGIITGCTDPTLQTLKVVL